MSARDSRVKVINLGLGRTGTFSFLEAMNILGLGPCYHMAAVLEGGVKHIDCWENVHRGINVEENLLELFNFQPFQSGCDYPLCLYPEALLRTFPEAKYVLSTRPVAQWKRSVMTTILPVSTTLMYLPSFVWPFGWRLYNWVQEILWGPKAQFEGNFRENAERKYEEHLALVKRTIPEEKLLVIEVGEGWDRLCAFLEVPVPNQPYPRSNDSASFMDNLWNHFPAFSVYLIRGVAYVQSIFGKSDVRVKSD